MPRYRSRSRTPSPSRRKRYDDPRGTRRERCSPAPSGLLVRNISLSARQEDLRIPFERFGPIKDIYLPKNYYTGEPRGFGFVKFRYPEDAAEAKRHLDCTVIGGREIRIVFAEENRKSPHEMRRVTRESSRGSYRRRSRSSSPRRRYRSHSRSPSPARHASRDGRRKARDDRYSPPRSRSVSRSVSPRDDRNQRPRERDGRRKARDDRHSPPKSRSVSRSVSPRDDRNHRPRERSQRHSRSLSRSVSPSDEKNYKNTRQSPNNRENVQARHADAPSGSRSPRRNSRSPARSRSRSHSPR